MTIRYQNTFIDMMAFNFYHFLHSPVAIGMYAVSFVLISLTFVRAIPTDLSPVAHVVTFIVMQFTTFFFVTIFFVVFSVLGMISRRNKTILTEHRITVGEASFVEETAYNKTDQKWASVQKLVRTKRYIFIYIMQHGAHVIPRRAFRDHSEWNSFYEFCRLRVGQAT
jgi:hypothetical protein